ARRAIPEHLVDGHALDLGARESVRASRHASRKSSAEHPCTGPQLGWAGRAPRRRGAVSIAATPLASLASPQPGYEWGPRRSISRTLRISASCASSKRSFARLAALHLRREPRSAGQWLRKLEVLIELVRDNQLARTVVLAV